MTHNNVGFLVHDVARLMRKTFDRDMKSLDLTRSQWWLLAYLVNNDGASQVELADLLDLSPVTTGSLIGRLEKKGYVSRRQDETDGRIKRVYMSNAKGYVYSQLEGKAVQHMDQSIQDLTPEERTQLEKLLLKVKNRLSIIDNEGSSLVMTKS